MRALIQRVAWSRVEVHGRQTGATGPGFLVLLGVARGDSGEDSRYLARRTAFLRIFEDEAGKMNLSILDTGGQALVVSQFTLMADTRKGNRPGFGEAALPESAQDLYHGYVDALEQLGVPVQTGVFGAEMAVTLCNEGPVTIMLESQDRSCK